MFSVHDYHKKCVHPMDSLQANNAAEVQDAERSHQLPQKKPKLEDYADPVLPSSEKPFSVVLDSYDLDIERVEALETNDIDLKRNLHNGQIYSDWLNKTQGQYLSCLDACCEQTPLQFKVEKWCVRFWQESVSDPQNFPRIVRIWYRTKREGVSLRWAKDVEGK